MRMDESFGQKLYSGVFQTKEEAVTYYLLKEINEHDGAVGAWTIQEHLEDKGMHYSPATIGRYLKIMDKNAYTVRDRNKGRVVTEIGAKWLKSKSEDLARAEMHNEASQAIQINKYTDLIDLMEARKAIELTAVQFAAREATQEEILELHKSTNTYYRYIAEKKEIIDTALDFHELVACMSHNKFIKTLYDILAFEEKQLESRIEVLATRTRGSNYVVQHDDIAAAIEAHDEELAKKMMEVHFETIINDLKQQIKEMQ